MNRYGAMAMSHWQEWLPARCRTLANPDEYFDQLGREVEAEIETLYRAMLTSEPSALAEDRRDGWRSMARLNAENQILTELVYLTPEDEDEERAAHPSALNASMAEMMSAFYEATDPFSATDRDRD
jgi:hypothetical protein